MKGDVIYVDRKLEIWEMEEIFPASFFSWLEERFPKFYFSFRHYGVDVGNEMVIHFGGRRNLISKSAQVKYIFLGDFLLGSGGKKVHNLFLHKKFSPDLIVERAKSQVGSDFGGYSLLTNNCEHFAFWCATGEKICFQVPFAALDNLKEKLFTLERGSKEIREDLLKIENNDVQKANLEGVWFATLDNFKKEIRQASVEEILRGK